MNDCDQYSQIYQGLFVITRERKVRLSKSAGALRFLTDASRIVIECALLRSAEGILEYFGSHIHEHP